MAKHTGIRTFDVIWNVDTPLEGGISDWPANIQDGLMEALEVLSRRTELPLMYVEGGCREDVDVPVGQPGHYFIHMIASEIVAADERTVNAAPKLFH